MSIHTIKTKKGSFTLLEPGIIRFTLNGHTELTLEDVQQAHKANLKLTQGGKYFTYMKATHFFVATREAQQFIASKECTQHRIAAVVVLQNSALKLLATLFIRFYKSRSPSRIFKSQAEAFKWMRAEYTKISAA